MTELLNQGWVRIRKVEGRGNEFWTIQVESGMGRSLPRTAKNSIINWAEKMTKKNEFWGDDSVQVIDTKGNILFGSSGINRKSIDDIYLDSTGVFESIDNKFKEIFALNESSLSRIFKHMSEHDTGTITAFRDKKDCNNPSVENNTYSKKENMQRNKSLFYKLQKLGYGVTSVKGSYIENYKSKDAKEVGENVFFVVDLKDTGKLKDNLKKLGEEFDQDSILFIPLSGKSAELIGTNKCPDTYPGYGSKVTYNKRKLGSEGEFMTRINGTPFIFESVIREHHIRKDVSYHRGVDIASKTKWQDIILTEEEEKILINESSLSRILSANIEHDTGALTAFRKGEKCGEGKPYSKKENKARNKSLLAKLKSKGYGITKLNGVYPEGGKSVKEISYFVVDIKDNGNLVKDLRSLGNEFDQDSVLIIPKGSIEGDSKAYLIGTNHCDNNWLGFGKKEVFNKGKLGYDSPIYTSFVNGRPFMFESVMNEVSSPASGFGVWSMYMASQKHWRELID